MNVLPKDAARALGISRRSLYNWTVSGHIPRDCVAFLGTSGQARYSLSRLRAAGFDMKTDDHAVAQ